MTHSERNGPLEEVKSISFNFLELTFKYDLYEMITFFMRAIPDSSVLSFLHVQSVHAMSLFSIAESIK